MFAALEARMNRTAMAKLANATVVIPGVADPVRVIFDAEYKPGMVGTVGMGASEPQMVIATSDVPADFVGTAITVDGNAWRVAERQADGKQVDGLTTVFLERP